MVDQTESQTGNAEAGLQRLENETQRVKSVGDQFTSALSNGLKDVALRGNNVRDVVRGLGTDLSSKTFSAAIKPLSSELQRATGFGDQFGRSLTKAFDDVMSRGESLKSVVSSLALDLSQMTVNSVFSTSKNSLGSWFLSKFSGESGAAATAASAASSASSGSGLGFALPLPFARGGVVSSPTFFPLAGGQTGVMGERGAEAILPLRRGADGRLGVAAQGGAGINVTFNVSSPDAASFQRSETQVSAMLARAVSRGQRNL